MQKRHDDLLTTRLETILNAGVAFVLWNELYSWYEVKKIAARTFRDLNERWEEIKTLRNVTSGKLMCVEGPEGWWLFSDETLSSIKERGNKGE